MYHFRFILYHYFNYVKFLRIKSQDENKMHQKFVVLLFADDLFFISFFSYFFFHKHLFNHFICKNFGFVRQVFEILNKLCLGSIKSIKFHQKIKHLVKFKLILYARTLFILNPIQISCSIIHSLHTAQYILFYK